VDLSIEFGEFAECALQHYGIDFNTFRYVSTELLALRRMLPAKQKVQIKAPYENASAIWVWNPIDCKYIRANNIDERFNNLTVEQARLLKRKYAESDPHQRTRADGEETIRQEAIEAMQSKKLKTRKKGARQAHTTSKSANRLPPVESQAQRVVPTAAFHLDGDELSQFDVESVNAEVNHDK
jgi:putative transposase